MKAKKSNEELKVEIWAATKEGKLGKRTKEVRKWWSADDKGEWWRKTWEKRESEEVKVEEGIE